MIDGNYLSGLYENISTCYLSLDSSGAVIDINDKCLKIFGYKRNEIEGGELFADLLKPDKCSEFDKQYSGFKSNGFIKSKVFELRHANGGYIPVVIDGHVVFDKSGNMQQFNLFFLTQQSFSQPSYSQIFNISKVPMIVIDAETKEIVDGNPAACSFYGYSYQELTSLLITDINIESKEAVAGYISEVVKAEKFFLYFYASNGERTYQSDRELSHGT